MWRRRCGACLWLVGLCCGCWTTRRRSGCGRRRWGLVSLRRRVQPQYGRPTRRTRLLPLKPRTQTTLVKYMIAWQLFNLLNTRVRIVWHIAHLFAANDANRVRIATQLLLSHIWIPFILNEITFNNLGPEMLIIQLDLHDVQVLNGSS